MFFGYQPVYLFKTISAPDSDEVADAVAGAEEGMVS